MSWVLYWVELVIFELLWICVGVKFILRFLWESMYFKMGNSGLIKCFGLCNIW